MNSSCGIASSFETTGSSRGYFNTELPPNVRISYWYGHFDCNPIFCYEIDFPGRSSFRTTIASLKWQLADW